VGGYDDAGLRFFSLQNYNKVMDKPMALDLNIISLEIYGTLLAVRSLSGLVGIFFVDIEVGLSETVHNSSEILALQSARV